MLRTLLLIPPPMSGTVILLHCLLYAYDDVRVMHHAGEQHECGRGQGMGMGMSMSMSMSEAAHRQARRS